MIDRITENDAELWLNRGSRRYAPGDAIVGNYRLDECRSNVG